MARTVQQMVDEALKEIRTLSIAEAIALHGDEDAQFVDLRDIRELKREGRMPGAFHAPRGMLEFWIDPECVYHKPVFAEDRHFVFFCAGGLRSALAAKVAQELGLKRVSHVDGGFGAWKEAGGPIETEA